MADQDNSSTGRIDVVNGGSAVGATAGSGSSVYVSGTGASADGVQADSNSCCITMSGSSTPAERARAEQAIKAARKEFEARSQAWRAEQLAKGEARPSQHGSVQRTSNTADLARQQFPDRKVTEIVCPGNVANAAGMKVKAGEVVIVRSSGSSQI